MKQFKEGLNTAVFTTRFVLNEGAEITSIFHYGDGSWQFSGSQTGLNDSDFKIISLRHAIEIDNSIIEVSDLAEGFAAFRNHKNDKWKVEPCLDL